jgi:hypothetical protein
MPQVPLVQVALPLSGTVQTTPHLPQLLVSLLVLVQVLLQQVWPLEQPLPHPPQLSESLVVSVHIPPQQVSVPGHSPVNVPQVHWLFTQLSPGEQTVLQPPQWLVSLLVSVQVPLQQVWPLAQQVSPAWVAQHWPVGQQTPLQQLWPLGQTLPQAPQLFESVSRLVQAPLQQVGLLAFAPTPHILPQTPQLQLSPLRLVQPVLPEHLALGQHTELLGQHAPLQHWAEVQQAPLDASQQTSPDGQHFLPQGVVPLAHGFAA